MRSIRCALQKSNKISGLLYTCLLHFARENPDETRTKNFLLNRRLSLDSLITIKMIEFNGVPFPNPFGHDRTRLF